VVDDRQFFLATNFFNNYAQESVLHNSTGTDDSVTVAQCQKIQQPRRKLCYR